MFSSVRARLTLWYVFVFGLLLVGFSVLVYTSITHRLFERADRSLSTSVHVMATEFQSEIAECNGDAALGAVETLKELQLRGLYMAILADETTLASNFSGDPKFLVPYDLRNVAKIDGHLSFLTVGGFGSEGVRVALLPVKNGGRDYFVAVAEPRRELMDQIAALRRTFFIGLPVSLLIAGAGGFLLAKKSLAPVIEMSDQAKRIGAMNLQDRLKVNNPRDELGQLAGTFNELLSRLNLSFDNMREFMADASHEFRTPLSVIRGEADVALSQERGASEYKETIEIIQDEARRLSRIVEDMMALARADAGQYPVKVEEFYLNDLVEEACRAMKVSAVSNGIDLKREVHEDVVFFGDEDLMRRLILNLLDNAINYTPSGGSVSVALTNGWDAVRIIVSDTGPGIPAEDAPHVFERFYRVDKARSRRAGGSGLGLSISRWIAEAHRGSIDLTSTPGQGSRFTVSFSKPR